jgi:hypothetical protein
MHKTPSQIEGRKSQRIKPFVQRVDEGFPTVVAKVVVNQRNTQVFGQERAPRETKESSDVILHGHGGIKEKDL